MGKFFTKIRHIS